jgi:hypothetical protein
MKQQGIIILLYMSSLIFNANQDAGTKNKMLIPKIPVIRYVIMSSMRANAVSSVMEQLVIKM